MKKTAKAAIKEKPTLLIEPKDIKPSIPEMRVRGVFNPGAVRLPNGKILLMARVAETPIHGKRYFISAKMAGTEKHPKMKTDKIPRTTGTIEEQGFHTKFGMWKLPTLSHLRKIYLDETGMFVEKLGTEHDFCGCGTDGDLGVEDPRITHFKRDNFYAMTYVSVSAKSGVSTSLATSKNLQGWTRHGIIFRQQNKDVVLFPEKIKGYYVALHRPEGAMIFDKPSIWISYSKDLIYWGRDKTLLAPRETGWDSLRIGPGTIPIKIKEGYLELYHGVRLSRARDPDSKKIYSAGALLFDAKNPEKILARSPVNKPLFLPDPKTEKKGFMEQVVFPTGAVTANKGKDLLVYSGGADSRITVRKMAIKDILNSLE
jgi:predicted GH43/DUF377 family glycosyl hydrolase